MIRKTKTEATEASLLELYRVDPTTVEAYNNATNWRENAQAVVTDLEEQLRDAMRALIKATSVENRHYNAMVRKAVALANAAKPQGVGRG